MSSHHIVRDEQEPALLIVDSRAYSETIGQLLEWSPVVVVAYPALPAVLQWGCKVDVVICEPSLKTQVESLMEMQIPYAVWHPSMAESLLYTGLKSLKETSHQAVNILGEVEILLKKGKELLEWSEKLDIILYEPEKRWRHLSNRKYEKWLAQGAKIWIPTTEAIVFADNIEQRNGMDYHSVIADGMVTFKLEAPSWIAEQI